MYTFNTQIQCFRPCQLIPTNHYLNRGNSITFVLIAMERF